MKQITAVFHNQVKVFLRDKGMMIFYLLAIVLIGIAVPFFGRGILYSLSFATLMTATFVTPILADGMAGEREKRTLESLLSTSIKGSRVVWGKFLFVGLFAAVFFSLCAIISVVTHGLFGMETGFSSFLWICAGLLALMNFTTTALGGLYQSALSGDTRIAYSRVSLIAFPMGIIYVVALSALSTVGHEERWLVLAVFIAVYGVIAALFAIMIVRLRQHTYFQKVRFSRRGHTQRIRTDELRSHSQVFTVFAHEMRYVAKLKMLMLMFALFCIAPAAMCVSGYAYFGDINLNLSVLVTALMVPRTTTNLIAYSIGGEKTYKTAESLLSTPLKVGPMFLAKMLVPVAMSAVMLVISSTLTIVGVNIVGEYFEGGIRYLFTADQLVQLFPASILASVSMVLVTGVLSARMKRPRNGLYVSSIMGLLFVVPPLCIMYLTPNPLLWSLLYCAIMLIVNAVSLICISKNISRPQLMSWI